MTVYMLSTADNPFSPFTQWVDWRRYDEDKGYYTCEYLAKIAITSDDLSDADYQQAINYAIDEILELNILGNYIKVSEDSINQKSDPGGASDITTPPL